jgi:hypothetical protein
MLSAVIHRHPLIVAGLLLALGTTSAYAAPPTMPVAQVRSGQKGYGLSVFKGFKVERFSVEVIDVLKNFLPKQDIILMRGDHPVLRRAGVLGGMSGSPIYLQGKLVGALAYGWRFSKEPIFGVTPIGNMLKLFKRKTRGPDSTLRVARKDPVARSRLRRLLASLDRRSDPFAKLRWRLPKRAKARGDVLRRVNVPLSVAGMPASSLPELRQAFSRYGFEPLQGGGTGNDKQGPKRYEQGSAIGVSLVRGDIAMTGTGTVTYVQGKKVVAFGHSMFNAGEIYLPMTTARINHTLASLSRSFKLSSPGRRLGVLVQDRQPGIMADTSKTISMVPMTLTLKSKLDTSVYKLQLAKHRFLTASLVRSVITKSVKEAMSDVAPATYTMTSSCTFKGHPTLTIKEENFTSGGLRMGLFFSRGVRAIRTMSTNPLAKVDLERIDIKIEVTFGKRPLTLLSLRAPSSTVRPGETIRIEATLREYGGKKVKRSFPLTIPSSMQSGILMVELAGGRYVRPDRATPENVKQLIAYLKKGYPGRSAVLSLYLPTRGLSMGGRVLEDLPPSVLDSLRAGTVTATQNLLKTKLRRVFATQQLIAGRGRIRLRVQSEVTQ